MIFRSRRARRRPIAAVLALALLVASTLLAAAQPPAASAQDDPTLLVDDAKTANPDLVATKLVVPSGVDVATHTVNLPRGFAISVVAAGLDGPRFMTFDDAGNLLVAAVGAGAVYRYPAADGAIAPAATPPEPLLTDLNLPSSLALLKTDDGEYLYVGETNQVSRYRYDPSGSLGQQEVVIPDLPNKGQHYTRTVVAGPDGRLYLGIGSDCNICVEEDDRRAAISRANADGSDFEVIAHGLRNPVGLAFEPGTDQLWATVNERDNQGNEIPPDLVTTIQEGANYGWPTCQPPDAKPQEAGDDCSNVTPPTVGIQAHSAPLGLAFYDGKQFPTDYRGDIIVAQHGSWNRQPPAAPKLLLIDLKDGKPTGATDFATGWQDADGNRWGRPTGVAVAPDGSLVVSDDDAGLLYRITYQG